MPRASRASKAASVHHVVNRGARRLPIFGDDADRAAFIGMLGDAMHEFDSSCVALCLMGNHFHLILSAEVDALSLAMQSVSSRFTQRFNHRYGFDGSVFKGRYYSSPIRDDRYLGNCIRYVDRNPLSIDSYMDLSTYRWSTHRHYLGLAKVPDWLNLETGLRPFGGSVDNYAAFVAKQDPRTPAIDEFMRWFGKEGAAEKSTRGLALLAAKRYGLSDSQVAGGLQIGSLGSLRSIRSRAARSLDSGPGVELIERCLEHFGLEPGAAAIGPSWLRDDPNATENATEGSVPK